jgi:hypothetical protein
MLAEMDLRPGRPKDNAVTLAVLKIGENQSRRWQKLASVPEDKGLRHQ